MTAGHAASNIVGNGAGKYVPAVGSDELAEGLMLMRASAISVVRLQLAMERRDRRVALQAVDDLVELDGRLEELLGAIPASSDLVPLQRALEDGRSALTREKWTLAAEASGRTIAATTPAWAESEQQTGEPLEQIYADEPDEAKRNRIGLAAASLLAVLITLGAAWFAAGGPAADDLIATVKPIFGG